MRKIFIKYFRQKIALQNARKLHALKKQCAVDSDQLSTDPMLRLVFENIFSRFHWLLYEKLIGRTNRRQNVNLSKRRDN